MNPFIAYQALAFVELATGSTQRAIDIMRDACGSFDVVEDPWNRAHQLSGLATYEGMAGQLDEARTHAEAAREIARPLQNPGLSGDVFHSMAWAYQRDEPTVALEAAQRCVDLMRVGLATGGGLIGVYGMLAGLRFRTGDVDDAIGLLREAVLAARDMGARPQLAAALDWSLSPLVRIGRPAPAAGWSGRSMTARSPTSATGRSAPEPGREPSAASERHWAMTSPTNWSRRAPRWATTTSSRTRSTNSHRPESPPKRRQNVRTECSRQYTLRAAQNGTSVRSRA